MSEKYKGELPEGGELEEPKEKHYTLKDFETAKAELERLREQDANDTSGNINKYHSRIKDAVQNVRIIEHDLKAKGLMEFTPHEKLNRELDELYPNAKSKSIVEYQGRHYQIRYYPLDTSRSGKTVFEWGHSWNLVEDEPKKPKGKK